ncbi:MAG: hypothetical protein SF123_06990 [Chloroflexota bacterium]|nr:hypothetical protein [Chloroflexota bacterium]
MSLRTLIIILSLSVFTSVGLSHSLHGQDNVCPALVERALTEVGTNCTGLGRNTACYGFNRVNATFSQELEAGFFSEPADQASIDQIETIQTNALDVDAEEWGIAVLNVQANLPNALPGQAVTFVLLGDVALENVAAPTPPGVIADILTVEPLNVRSLPNVRANVLASVPSETLLVANGISDDGEWLRVEYQDIVGWVSRVFVISAADLTTLPAVEAAPYGTMQAFMLQTNVMGVSCTEAPPSLLVVQSPRNITITLNVNGVGVSLGSTLVFTANAEEGMSIGVIDGHAQLDDGTYIPEGFSVRFSINEFGMAVGDAGPVQRFVAEELAALAPLENIPPVLLNYSISVEPGGDEALQMEPSVSTPLLLPTDDLQGTATPVTDLPGDVPPLTPTGLETPTIVSPIMTATEMLPTMTPTEMLPTATPPPVVPSSTPAPTLTTSLLPLGVNAPCVARIGDDRPFVISNPNAVDVNFSWTVDGSVSGNDTVSANSSRSVTVSRQPGNNIITVDWGYGSGSANSNPCPSVALPPVPAPTATPVPQPTEIPTMEQQSVPLNLGTTCTPGSPSTRAFVISNPNTMSVDASITVTWTTGTVTFSQAIDAGGSVAVDANAYNSGLVDVSVSWTGGTTIGSLGDCV